MKITIKPLITVSIAIVASGCASYVHVYDAKGSVLKGIPVGTPVLVKLTERTTYVVGPDPASKKFEKYCNEEVSSKYQFMPLGEKVYISFDPAQFGKSEYKLEFSDSGSLKVVSVNSDASANVGKAVDLLTASLPYFAKKKEADTEPASLLKESAKEIKEKHCLKVSTKVDGVEVVQIEQPNSK